MALGRASSLAAELCGGGPADGCSPASTPTSACLSSTTAAHAVDTPMALQSFSSSPDALHRHHLQHRRKLQQQHHQYDQLQQQKQQLQLQGQQCQQQRQLKLEQQQQEQLLRSVRELPIHRHHLRHCHQQQQSALLQQQQSALLQQQQSALLQQQQSALLQQQECWAAPYARPSLLTCEPPQALCQQQPVHWPHTPGEGAIRRTLLLQHALKRPLEAHDLETAERCSARSGPFRRSSSGRQCLARRSAACDAATCDVAGPRFAVDAVCRTNTSMMHLTDEVPGFLSINGCEISIGSCRLHYTSLPSCPSGEEYIHLAARVLQLCPETSVQLAIHVWRRISGMVRLVLSIRHPIADCDDPGVAASTRRIYATACLWLSAKLEEQRRLVPEASMVAALAQTSPGVLCAIELRVLAWVEWCPLRWYLL